MVSTQGARMTDADRFLHVRWPCPHDAEPDFGALPDSRGVGVFEDDRGRTCLVATGADLRALARRRLAPASQDGARPGADLRAITSVVRAATTGSALESDLIYLDLIRKRLPHVYRSVTDRWRGWFLDIDPEEPFPRFTKTSTGAMPGTPPHRTILGPIADKHAGAKFIELLEDLFDLCREHQLLVQAPNATACVYKEMGKCPAPCDGSESMADYRARLREAIAFAQAPSLEIERVEAEMRRAADATEFERAETLRKWIERARPATHAKFRNVRTLERFRLVGVAPSGRDAWARLIAIVAGRWSIVADVRRDAADPDVAARARHALDALAPRPLAPDFSQASLDHLGLVCAWLARPMKNRRAVRFIWDDDRFETGLLDAIRRDPGAPDEEEPGHEIGAERAQEPTEP